jgi:hypothetical protein
MGGCSVTGCRNRFVRGSKHFFRFPKDWRKDVWIKFTQRQLYDPKGSSVICEDHFATECFQKKKDRVCLSKTSVPTIMHKTTGGGGVQKIEVKFDEQLRCYDENDLALVNSFKTTFQQEDEEALMKRRQEKLDEFKTLCRFCFCNNAKNEFNCVQLQKLESYSIDVNDLMEMLGMDTQSNDTFSEIVCEQCFHLLVEIDAFRKKCCDTQKELLSELQDFDDKIIELRNSKGYSNDKFMWMKSEDMMIEEQPMDGTIEILEEHLIDDQEEYAEQYGINEEEQLDDEIEYIEEIPEEFNIVYAQNEEMMGKDMTEQEIIVSETPVEYTTEPFEYQLDASAKSDAVQGVDEYEAVTTDDIIKNPDRNRFCFRIYECFFCKMVRSFHCDTTS